MSQTPDMSNYDPRCAARHITQWCVEPRWFADTFSAIRAGIIKPRAMDDDEPRRPERPPYQIVGDGIAVISIVGAMMKGWSKYADVDTLETRKALRKARNSSDVRGIMLRFDTPGGAVDGTMELADDIAATARIKPTHAYAEDCCCSAGLWTASQAARLSGNANARVGSIGVYGVVHDTSAKAQMEGVKVMVIGTGGMKGAFTDGTPITDEQIEYAMEGIAPVNEFFIAAVAKGRHMKESAVREISKEGKSYNAADAKSRGLIDEVETFERAIGLLESAVKSHKATARGTRAAQIAIAEKSA